MRQNRVSSVIFRFMPNHAVVPDELFGPFLNVKLNVKVGHVNTVQAHNRQTALAAQEAQIVLAFNTAI